MATFQPTSPGVAKALTIALNALRDDAPEAAAHLTLALVLVLILTAKDGVSMEELKELVSGTTADTVEKLWPLKDVVQNAISTH